MASVEEDFYAHLSVATQEYMTRLIRKMSAASHHRVSSSLDEFSCRAEAFEIVPVDDPRDSIYRIEQKERVEYDEIFALIGAREEVDEGVSNEGGIQIGVIAPTATSAAPPSLTEKPKITKKKSDAASTVVAEDKEGKRKRSSKKDLPEAVKTKMANSAALMAAGGTVKSWMLPTSHQIAMPPKKNATKVISSRDANLRGEKGGIGLNGSADKGSRAARRVMLRDALFVIGDHRNFSDGELLYRWNSNIK